MLVQTEGVTINLDNIVKIASVAGDAILEVYNQDAEHWNVQSKGEAGPVTAADLKAHQIIVRELAKITPTIPVLSEEGDLTQESERASWKSFWCVDPLDGTKEFIKRNGEFTVNIALVEGNKPIAGVITVPVTGEIAWGVRGQGSFLRKFGETDAIRLRCPSFELADPDLVLIGSRSGMTKMRASFLSLFKDHTTLVSGSTIKFLRIAEGKAHIYPRFFPTSEWDTCAAQIILEEAGGRIIQATEDGRLVTGLPTLRYNKPSSLLNPCFVAFGATTGIAEFFKDHMS